MKDRVCSRSLRNLLWALPLLLGSCKSDSNGQRTSPIFGEVQDSGVPTSGPDSKVGKSAELDPRSLDILFMVDNSPSMDPKQAALAEAFPKLIEVLQKVPGGMPDLHIGVVSSDMGAGNGEAGGNCAVVLGNQGILWGNDPGANPDDLNNKYATVKKVKNAAGVLACGMDSGARWIEDLGSVGGERQRNYQGQLTDVFSCLAKAVGTNGCGYEHQLQSVRVALNPTAGVANGNLNPQNLGFLRPKAYLAIVLVSDEDDCSADPSSDKNDGIFMARQLGDTASLRCAARGHVCNGQNIPDYDSTSGYMGKGFSAKFADCEAKDSSDPHELPLIRVRDMIDSVNQVKAQPEEQILSFGIIGWPQGDNLEGLSYRISVDQQNLWDYLPFCYASDQKSADGSIYRAYGSYRLKKFLDELKKPNETNVISVCDPWRFAEALSRLGKLIVGRLEASGSAH